MDVFYKGEDILLELALFSDNNMDSPIALSGFWVDVILYCNGTSDVIHCSSRENIGNISLVMLESALRCVIFKNLLKPMQCGVYVVEVRLVDKIDNTSRIVKKYAFSLEDTAIKDL